MTSQRIKTAVAETADHLHDSVDEVEDTVDESVDDIGDRFVQFEERLQEETERLIDTVKEITTAASRYAHARPVAAAGIAFIAGLVAARALRR